jgi:hypothetical protein
MPAYANPFEGVQPGPDEPGWQNWFLNYNPEAGFTRYLQDKNLYGLDPVSRFAGSQYGRTYGRYQSQAAENPNLGFWDWIKAANLDLAGEYKDQSPTARGDFSDRTVSNRARFMRAY